MTAPRDTPGLDAFSSDLERAERAGELDVECAAELGLTALCEGLPALAPSSAARARLFEAVAAEHGTGTRLARFASQVAELLDVGLDKARELLARIDDAAAWSHELPGISFLWVEGGPSVAQAVRGFVRIQAGLHFPDHEHLGDETVLVLQGGFEDRTRGCVFRPGDIDRMPKGSHHDYYALGTVESAPDLLKLAVVQNGLRALGQTYLPR